MKLNYQETTRLDCLRILDGREKVLEQLRQSELMVIGGTGFVGTRISEIVAALNDEFQFGIRLYLISRSTGNLLNNPNTQLAAEAAYCAADQDMYWEYHDLIYSNQGILFYGGITFIDNYLNAFADTLGLDMNEFKDCLSEGKYNGRVLKDGNDAKLVGINSTPSFLINGTLVRGNLPYQEFQAYIDGAIDIVDNQ